MFTTAFKITRKAFIKKYKEESNTDLSESDAKLLMSVSSFNYKQHLIYAECNQYIRNLDDTTISWYAVKIL